MLNENRAIVYSYDTENFYPPAPALEVSLSAPVSTFTPSVKSLAILDSGADMTVIPQQVVQQLQLKCVDEILVSGFDGILKKYFVYSVKLIFDNLGDFVIRTLAEQQDYIIIGRDILNRWLLFLKGPNKIFEIIRV